jgi:hypothetical protein
MPDILVIREQIVESLSSALRMGRGGLEVVPGLLRRAINEEVWKERKDYRLSREIIPAFPSFRAFVEAKPPAGLGTNTDLIERIIRDDGETLAIFQEQIKAQGTRNDLRSNPTEVRNDRGRAYTLARLKRSRADLFARVVADELSANAAAVEAGFKKKQSPLDVLRAAWRKASSKEREAFRREIDAP